jgi:sporulation protein YlmC with PRC-barrel domain
MNFDAASSVSKIRLTRRASVWEPGSQSERVLGEQTKNIINGRKLSADVSDSKASPASQGVARSTLLGMQVYNPNGTLVGTIHDVVLPLGPGEISVQLLTKLRTIQGVPWSNIAAVGDIVILKEVVELKQGEPGGVQPTGAAQMQGQPLPQQVAVADGLSDQTEKKVSSSPFSSITSKISRKKEPARTCPTCGGQLTFIDKYQRWYCYAENKYK